MFGSKKGKAVAIENEVSSLQERQRETEWDLIVATGSLENANKSTGRALVEPDSELSSAKQKKKSPLPKRRWQLLLAGLKISRAGYKMPRPAWLFS